MKYKIKNIYYAVVQNIVSINDNDLKKKKIYFQECYFSKTDYILYTS